MIAFREMLERADLSKVGDEIRGRRRRQDFLILIAVAAIGLSIIGVMFGSYIHTVG